MFGDTLEEMYQKAWKKVNNSPRMNIVILVVNRQEVTIKDPTVPRAEYTSTPASVRKAKFQVGDEKTIIDLFGQGYRFIDTKSNTYSQFIDRWNSIKETITVKEEIDIYNRKSIKIYKEENGTNIEIGQGYDVNGKPYSIDYISILKRLGYTNIPFTMMFTYKDGTTIIIQKATEMGYIIDNVAIEEIQNKTGLNKSYDKVNGIILFTINNKGLERLLNDYKTTMNLQLISISMIN